MLKQSSSKMKKVLAILLAVLFVVSLTAVAASANGGGYGRDGGYGRGGCDDGYGYGLGGDGWDAGSPFPPYYPYAGPQVIAIDYRYYNQPGI